MERKVKEKTMIDFIQAHSLRDLMSAINDFNKKYPESAILKEDIVDIINEGNSYILLYYKSSL